LIRVSFQDIGRVLGAGAGERVDVGLRGNAEEAGEGEGGDDEGGGEVDCVEGVLEEGVYRAPAR
jgi:hypothetical protein